MLHSLHQHPPQVSQQQSGDQEELDYGESDSESGESMDSGPSAKNVFPPQARYGGSVNNHALPAMLSIF